MYGRMPVFGVERERSSASRASSGSRRTAAKLAALAGRFRQPNGLCFSPDETLLYINDTRARISASSTSQATARSANGRMFFDSIGSGVIEDGIPDGMKCDERGNVWVTGPGGIWVISPDGEHLGRSSRCPENVGNLELGRRTTGTTLYMPSLDLAVLDPMKRRSAAQPT